MEELQREDGLGNEKSKKGSKITLPEQPYRGIKPFRYADRLIFSARDWEKEQLLNLILLYRGSLLYGQSGIGKSSLVNAGLIPLLEENNLQAEIIRVYPNYNEPFRIYKIENSDNDETHLPSLFDKFSTGDDQVRVCVTLQDFKKEILQQTYGSTAEEQELVSDKPLPVLIFDQFEEIITLFEETGNIATAEGDIPVKNRLSFQTELFEFFRDCYYDPNLRVKFLFSFREDYLAKMSKFLRAIPDLRDHSLRIKSISRDEIFEIINSPYRHKNSKNVYDSTFEEYLPLLSEKLTEYFKDRNAVLTDVQIVSQYLYDTPEDRMSLESLTEDDEHVIDKLIQLFYAKLLDKLDPKNKPLAIAILSLLVLNEHTRNIYHTDAIVEELIEEYKDPSLITQVLLNLDEDTRLIKSELRGGVAGAYYEINSESLIPYINKLKLGREKEIIEKKAAKELKEAAGREKILKKEKQDAINKSIRSRNALIILICVFLIATGIWGLYQRRISEENKGKRYLVAAKLVSTKSAENPSLGYYITQMGLNKVGENAELTSYANKQASKFFHISNIFYNPDNIITCFFKGNETLGIVDESSIKYFDKRGLLLKQRYFNRIMFADAKRQYLMNKVSNTLVSLDDKILDTNEICTFDGRFISRFNAQQNPENFAISPNGETFVVDDCIFKKGIFNYVHRLVIPEVGRGIASLLITNDNKHIVVGCYSGLVIVFDINGNKIKAMQDSFYSFEISCMAMTNDSKYLILGGNDNSLCFFELDLKGDGMQPSKKKIQNRPSLIYPTYLTKNGAKGKINQVIISPNNKSFLAVDNSANAIIWSLEGKEEKVLPGHKYGVVCGNYSPDGESILTGSSAGAIYIWRNNSDKMPKQGPFSPLDYRMATFDEIRKYDVYKEKGTADELLSNIVNYMGSLPRYETDTIAWKELSDLINDLLQKPKFDQLSSNNKKLLYQCYGNLKIDSLTAKSKKDDLVAILIRDYEMDWRTKALMVDTADLQNAVIYSYRYIFYAKYYRDELNFNKASICLEQANLITRAFLDKFPKNSLLQQFRLEANVNQAWFSIRARNFDLAITAAKRCIEIDRKNDWAYANIAVATLLKGDYLAAKKLYDKYKNAKKSNGGFFKEAFLRDLENLTKEGIINLNDKKLTSQVNAIKLSLNN